MFIASNLSFIPNQKSSTAASPEPFQFFLASSLLSFIKDWLKTHGFTQKDLANELNIKSSRTSEIILKMKE